MYRAPVADITHALRHVCGRGEALAAGRLGDHAGELGDDLIDAILVEAGRFATERIAPLHLPGDRHGARRDEGGVTMPPGWKQLYADWIAGGWNALAGPRAHGGQGLPTTLAMAAMEMWCSASIAFGLCPTLTMGAVEALDAHGSDALKSVYLEKLVTGEWTGTMNLTEPQAGSDLGALKTRAEPAGDGTYRIFGQKIYITYGDHDLTDNIVHLVLARLPDAPAGTRGISLFLVPKFLVEPDGSTGARNDVVCSGIERKLGIHASPTCTMIYGEGRFGETPGAIGWLVGEENRGLNCMFTMMNNARLAVGIQGVAVAEAAFQKARAYANERRQGRAPGWNDDAMSPIVLHPDVQRNLLTMKALTGAARGICQACAHAIDMARGAPPHARPFWHERAGLLTPLAKAFSTDIGSQVASLGVQVHGGMGYIEEAGAAIYMRDARIAQIYEGTNGIQAIDLVQRKLPLSDGACVNAYLDELATIVDRVRAANAPGLGETARCLDTALADLRAATAWLLARLDDGDRPAMLAAATPYQHLFGLVAGGACLAAGALAEAPDSGERIALARFYAENLLAQATALRDRVEHGAASLHAAAEHLVGP
ncbi:MULTISPECIES: acyl-CoA dehydrogenase [unclassified Roseitalea]|uniref:acyl-CoA dehydrogenase n=1 Tax=unclassified Roseitalea TaxID=2639107 RepID=UPI00273D48F4|nr:MULTISPECIES: acyl-CoA dehydrogenase [unclassified Roseitalea]